MSSPVWVPTDPLPALREFLAERWAERDPRPRVALNLSSDWTRHTGPEVVLADDSGPMRWPVETLPQLRVTVYAGGRSIARDVAGVTLGWLLCLRVPGIAKILPGAALIDARDPDTTGHVASFTVRARVRTHELD
ncbi:hypothetical protein [Skermania piniformis]|uniref:Tail terminator n=1 Tax=Skermania pinensis TaxID=39122 RepID=A0ABX8SAF8_9ACTN|nr:hypothetical protein [Skermania piniformis]QXQ14843.1 hypothetical protein KV203_05530 [Skermania piniformis]